MRNEVCDITGNCYTPTCERVYIGARYVPQLEGKHDPNRSYENFSIVVDGNNNSYTSRRGVPEGIELTDTYYWVMTGNYEGILKEIEKRLQEQITANKGDIDALKLAVEAINKEIVALKDSDTLLTSAVSKNASDIVLNKIAIETNAAGVTENLKNHGVLKKEFDEHVKAAETRYDELERYIPIRMDDSTNNLTDYSEFEVDMKNVTFYKATFYSASIDNSTFNVHTEYVRIITSGAPHLTVGEEFGKMTTSAGEVTIKSVDCTQSGGKYKFKITYSQAFNHRTHFILRKEGRY